MRPPRDQAERCSQCRKFKDYRWSVQLDPVEVEAGRLITWKHLTIRSIMTQRHDLEDIIRRVLKCSSFFFGGRYLWLSADRISTFAHQLYHMMNCKGLPKLWSQDCYCVIRRILAAWKSSSNKLPHDSGRNIGHEVDVGESPHQVENLLAPSIITTRIVNPKFEFSELPRDIQGQILAHLPYEQIFQLKANFSSVKCIAQSDELASMTKPSLTACYFFIKNGDWNWAGYDPGVKKWRLLPPLTFLPVNCTPDPELFKEYLICAKEGLVCMNFSKSAHQERLIVFNPLSRACKELPPLKYRRNPVFMHMVVDTTTGAYQVIVAGASNSLQEEFSRITEVYNSCTGMWTRTGDIPGPLFAINEYQSGVCQDGKIICIGFVEENDFVGKGLLAYDVREGKWSSKWTHQLQFSMSSSILQPVECNGQVFLFSERESGGCIEHCIERLEWSLGVSKNECRLVKVASKRKTGGRGLEIYPEYVCVPYGDGQLCILNTVEHSGVVYDVCNQGQYVKATYDMESLNQFPLQELPEKGFRGESFFSLNPMSFTIEPRFSSKVGIA